MCGSSMLVEWAKAKTDRRDRDRFSGRNSFHDRDRRSLECYECGERGHFARDVRFISQFLKIITFLESTFVELFFQQNSARYLN